MKSITIIGCGRVGKTLLRNARNNILTLGPAALTGPAARGDSALVQRQGEAVAQWNATAARLTRR
ncbi:MAG TPA: DUF2520 domain-containing protein [Rhodoferax sp.]